KGGQPAAAQECRAARQGAETSSSYEADYYFYAPGKGSGANAPTIAPGAPGSVLGGTVTGDNTSEKLKPQRIRVSQAVLQGLLVSKSVPNYPQEAKDRHIEGDVLLRVGVDKDGNVYKVEPESGDSLLLASAEDAVKQWKYKPFLLN